MDRGWFARHFFLVTCSFLDAGNSVIHVASNRNVPPNTCVTTDACKAFCSNNSRPPNCSKCRLVVRHVLLITLFLTLYISRPRMPEIPRHTCARNYFHFLPVCRAALSRPTFLLFGSCSPPVLSFANLAEICPSNFPFQESPKHMCLADVVAPRTLHRREMPLPDSVLCFAVCSDHSPDLRLRTC